MWNRRSLFRDTTGAAYTEAIIVLPVFLLLWVGVIYVGQSFQAKSEATQLARRCAWAYSNGGCDAVPALWVLDLAENGDVAAAGETVHGPTPLRGQVCVAFGAAALMVETSELEILPAAPLSSATVRREVPTTRMERPVVLEMTATRDLRSTVPARPAADVEPKPKMDPNATALERPAVRIAASAEVDPHATRLERPATRGEPEAARDTEPGPFDPSPTVISKLRAEPAPDQREVPTVPPEKEESKPAPANVPARPSDPLVTQRFVAIGDAEGVPSAGPQPTLIGSSAPAVVARPRLGLAACPEKPIKEGDWKRRVHMLRPATPVPEQPAAAVASPAPSEPAPPAPAAASETAPPTAVAPEAQGSPPAFADGSADAASPWRCEPPPPPPKRRVLPPRRTLLMAALVPAAAFALLFAGGRGETRAAENLPPAPVAPAPAEATAEPEVPAGETAAEEATEVAAAAEPAAGTESETEPAAGTESETEPAAVTAVARETRTERRGRGDAPTAEREAIELVAAGRYAEAVTRYELLAQDHPDRPELATVAEILRRKMSRPCGQGGAPCN